MSEREPADSPGVIIFPPGVYLSALVVGAIIQWFLPLPITPVGVLLVRVLGVVGIVVGGPLLYWARETFARVGTSISPFEASTNLATEGPFAYSRNPIYLGMTLILIGLAGLANSLWLLLAAIPAVIVIQTQVIEKEEKYLERRFGAAYLDYSKRVRRWM